jgi:hypothetical protein
MSIYCTILSIEDERQTQQALNAAGIGYHHFADGEEVEDLNDLADENLDAPIIYQGSHVLPSDDDSRGGQVHLASIPDHITRDGRDDAPEGSKKQFLRLSVNDATIVLTKRQAQRLHDSIGEWLATR